MILNPLLPKWQIRAIFIFALFSITSTTLLTCLLTPLDFGKIKFIAINASLNVQTNMKSTKKAEGWHWFKNWKWLWPENMPRIKDRPWVVKYFSRIF